MIQDVRYQSDDNRRGYSRRRINNRAQCPRLCCLSHITLLKSKEKKRILKNGKRQMAKQQNAKRIIKNGKCKNTPENTNDLRAIVVAEENLKSFSISHLLFLF